MQSVLYGFSGPVPASSIDESGSHAYSSCPINLFSSCIRVGRKTCTNKCSNHLVEINASDGFVNEGVIMEMLMKRFNIKDNVSVEEYEGQEKVEEAIWSSIPDT